MLRFRERLLLVVLACLIAVGVPVLADESSPSGWIGVFLGGRASDRLYETTERPAGVQISGVVADGPAARAGLRASDRILEVDGVPISRSAELIERIGGLEPSSWIPLTIDRRGREQQIRVRLDERPADTGSLKRRRGWIGLHAIEMPPALREHFGAPEDAGVMVSWVEPFSPAWTAGFELGDLVFEADGAEIVSPQQLARRVAMGGVGNDLAFRAMRDGAEIVLEANVMDAEDRPVPAPKLPGR